MIARRLAVQALAGGLASVLGLRPVRAANAPIRIAAPALDSTALAFYADDLGLFRAAGLDVELQAMANGETVTTALTGGAIDIGCSQAVSVIVAYKKGLPLTIIGAAGQQAPNAPVGMLFVPRSSTAQTGKDFNGKTVAVVGIRGLAQYGTQAWLDKTGGDSSSVKFIELSGAQIAIALADEKIDGAFVPEPFVGSSRKVARAITNPMEAIALNFMSAAHFSTTTWAKAHPEDIRKFQGVIRDAAIWANKNHDRSALVLERVAKVNPEVVRNAVRSYYTERMDPALLQPLIDVTAKYGGITGFAASELLYK